MIPTAFILSLQITAIYVVFEKTMLLGWAKAPLATWIDEACIYVFRIQLIANYELRGKRLSRYIQKPLWDCLPCMASVWTILLSWSFNIPLIFTVCGMNILINQFINNEGNA